MAFIKLRALATFILASSHLSIAAAEPVSDFYAGRTVTITVGTTAAGTYNLYARTIARYLGKYIPGAPRVVVANMPGASSYIAARHVLRIAPQDGAMIGALMAAAPFQPLIDPDAPKFDVEGINWLASPSPFHALMVVRADGPIQSADDLRKFKITMATIAPGQLASLLVMATNESLGARIQAINGHSTMNEAIMALERGEIDGYPAVPLDALKSLFADLVSAKKLRVILQFGRRPSPEYPDAPYALDLATTSSSKALLDLAQAPTKGGYIYMMGPDVPKERLDAIRSAFLATYRDPEFLAEAARQFLNIDPVSSNAMAELVTQAYGAPAEVVDRVRALYRKILN